MTNTDHHTPDIPLLPYGFAKDHVLIAQAKDGVLTVHTGPDAHMRAVAEVRRVLGPIDHIQSLDRGAFDAMLSDIYASRALHGELDESLQEKTGDGEDLDSVLAGVEQSADLLAGDDDAPVIKLLNSLLSEAVRSDASDVHLEPFEDKVSVRLRIDGMLTELASLTPRLAPYLVSRIKVMARLDIAEKRVPQDGRLSLTLGGKAYDVRVSTLPIRYGERVVLRLLSSEDGRVSLDELGMDMATKSRFEQSITQPNGIILVTGPTGSGKTTTLYAALDLINDQTRNIMTVEDPVEYALPGISQTQVNTKVGMTFASGLRSILRQDPDVVMVGEIRDMETAEMAVQASLTGHLVLSTVHTNGALAAISRLTDMGVERFLLSSTVKAILAQRLVRRLCDHCKTPADMSPMMLEALGVDADGAAQVSQPTGCAHCNHTGYKGRTGIYELVQVDETLQRMIHNGASEQDLANHAFAQHPTLGAYGRALVLSGITTQEEVLRVSRIKDG